jgi:hypothetical protein
MQHFWRSTKWICHDGAAPTRIFRPKAPNNAENYISIPYKVFHLGYAQSPRIIYYKQDIHGHKVDWRQDWFENKFMSWKPGDDDVHPTNVNFWTPVLYEDSGELERLIGDHPYYGMNLISEPWF